MGIRLLALDVDGTLTNGAQSVSPRNLAAVQAAQRAGVFVTLATGRGYRASRGVTELLGIDGPVIQYGGAWIADARTGRPLHIEAIDPALVREILLFSDRIGVHAQLYQGDTVVFAGENAFTKRYCSRLTAWIPMCCKTSMTAYRRCWSMSTRRTRSQ